MKAPQRLRVASDGPAVAELRRPSIASNSDGWTAPVLHGRAARRPPPENSDYRPGLDGLRALAVSAVVIYHLGAGWLPGGFLGVDVFFVLSGFLITSLLMQEWQRHGRIDIRRFYLRRARRLLPALFLMLSVVTFATAIIAPAQLSRLRGDIVAALFYVTNWTQILWNRSYFAALGPPSLLEHLWSLAVEEQFYLLWPIVLVACLASRRRGLPLLVTITGIAVSTGLMALWFSPFHDPSRVYYGSDTHAAPLLIGAAFALVRANSAARSRRHQPRSAGLGRATDLVALAGLAALAYFLLKVGYYRPGLYRGGYVLVGLATVAVMQGAINQASLTARVFGLPALRWIGTRSYGIYLWHWPIIQLTQPGLHPPVSGFALDVARVALSVGAAALSYRFVEHPIRMRGFGAVLRGNPAGARLRPAVVMGVIAAVVLAGAAQLAGASATNRATAQIQVDHAVAPTITIAPPTPTPSPKPTASSSTVTLSTVSAPSRGVAAAPTVSASPAPPPPPFPRPVRVGFFGDSQGMTLLLNQPVGLAGTLSLTDDTIEGCGILGGDISSTSGQGRDLSADCGGWEQTWAAHAARDKPQIAVIEIGAWDVFDDQVGGVELKFGSAAWDKYYSSQLAAAIHILTSAGAQVALLSIPCYQPISAGGLQALPERGNRTRTSHLNTLLTAAAKAQPTRVFMVASPQQFCTDPNVVGNTAYRWDGTHFYKPGAALEFQVITPELLAIPQPPH